MVYTGALAASFLLFALAPKNVSKRIGHSALETCVGNIRCQLANGGILIFFKMGWSASGIGILILNILRVVFVYLNVLFSELYYTPSSPHCRAVLMCIKGEFCHLKKRGLFCFCFVFVKTICTLLGWKNNIKCQKTTPLSPFSKWQKMSSALSLDVELIKLDMYQKYEHRKPWFIKVRRMFCNISSV